MLTFPQAAADSNEQTTTATRLSLVALPDGSLAASLDLELLAGVVALALRQQALPQLGSFSSELCVYPGAGALSFTVTGGADLAGRATLTLELP